MSDLIMVIDLGRYKSVVCLYHRNARDTTPDVMPGLSQDFPNALVGVEAYAKVGEITIFA